MGNLLAGITVRSPAPFIVGADRSGTTLLQAMLDAHPDLAIPPETYWLPDAIHLCQESTLPHQILSDFIVQQPRWPLFRLSEDMVRAAIQAVQPFDLAEALRSVYRLFAQQAGKTRWGDKTPHYLMHLPILSHLFPEARFIHLVRDGRDQALSILDTAWGPKTLVGAAQRWQQEVRWARWSARTVPHYLEIRYEQLVSNPEPVLRKVCKFIDLAWHPQILDYTTQSQVAQNTDYLALTHNPLVREPLQLQRIGRWRTEMTAEDVCQYEAIAGDLLEELGYDLITQICLHIRLHWQMVKAWQQTRWYLRLLRERLT